MLLIKSFTLAGVALCLLAACNVQTVDTEVASIDQVHWQEHKASTPPSARHENGFVAVGGAFVFTRWSR